MNSHNIVISDVTILPQKKIVGRPELNRLNFSSSQECIDAEKKKAEADLFEQAKKAGYEAGFKLGLQQGIEKGIADGHESARKTEEEKAKKLLQDSITRFNKLEQELKKALSERSKYLEEKSIQLATQIAFKVIGNSTVVPELCKTMLEEALSHTHSDYLIKIRIHPNDLVLIRSENSQLDVEYCGELQWIPDSSLIYGGCVLETDHGVLDASLQTQLDELKKVLANSRQAENG